MPNPETPVKPIRTVGLVARPDLQAAAGLLSDAAAWLERRGVQVLCDEVTTTLARRGVAHVSKDELVTRADLVVVLGGDGSLLSMADRIAQADADVPIMGVNFGSLGFLTEITLEDFYPALESVLDGTARIETRLMLRSRVFRGDELHADHRVLNDVAVNRGAGSPIIDLSVTVDSLFVTHVRADGLIIASPTGSTAYNLACGGPIVHPEVDAFVLTPIAPHTLTNRPVVIPATTEVRIQPSIEQPGDEVVVSFDGQESVRLVDGDIVSIRAARVPLRLVRSATRTYFEVLRQKLKWGER
jgi:NAD+ kinase